MRRLSAVVLSVAMIVAAIPAPAAAAARAQQPGGIQGIARDAQQQPLGNVTVQIRNVATGQLSATGTTNAAGQFVFSGLTPGNYVVEVVNAAGQIIGTSAPLTVAAGAIATVTVTASAAAAAAAAAGGFSLFGLGTAASAAIIGAAAVGITVGVVQATKTASPSR